MTELTRGHDLPEGPYSYETTQLAGQPDGTGHVYIIDAKGRKIASMWGKPAEKMALAELILHAQTRVEVHK